MLVATGRLLLATCRPRSVRVVPGVVGVGVLMVGVLVITYLHLPPEQAIDATRCSQSD